MAKVLVDTSAWIEFCHPRGAQSVKKALAQVLEVHEVVVVAPVVLELLSGVRTEEDCGRLLENLAALECLPLGWEEAQVGAELGRKLARTGRRVPAVDLLIAAAAQRRRYEIWHHGDAHFAVLQEAGGPPHRDLKAL